MKRQLVISSLESRPKDALFLGPWCLAGLPLEEALSLTDNVIRSPVQNWTDYQEVNKYLRNLAIQICSEFAAKHKGSQRQWIIKLSNFLTHFLAITYDVYLRVHVASKNGELIANTCDVSPLRIESLEEFAAHITTEEFLDVLVSDVLENLRFPNITISRSRRFPLKPAFHQPSKRDILRSLAHRIVWNTSGVLVTGFDHLNFREGLRIAWKFRKVKAMKSMRSELEFVKTEDPFSRLIDRMLPKYLPQNVFEKRKIPKTRLVVGSNTFNTAYANDVAEADKAGAFICQLQHGAGYGNLASFPLEFVEIETSDAFLTWGWKQSKEYPMAPLKRSLRDLIEPKFRPFRRVLILSHSYPLHTMRFHSSAPPDKLYREVVQRVDLITQLQAENIKVSLRPYHKDFGIGEVDFLRTKSVNVLDSGKPIDWSSISHEYDLVILDHFGTALFEISETGLPFICIWQDDFYGFNVETQKVMDEFKKRDLLFTKNEDAVKEITGCSDPRIWWMSKSDLPKIFLEKFYNRSLPSLEEILNRLPSRDPSSYSPQQEQDQMDRQPKMTF